MGAPYLQKKIEPNLAIANFIHLIARLGPILTMLKVKIRKFGCIHFDRSLYLNPPYLKEDAFHLASSLETGQLYIMHLC